MYSANDAASQHLETWVEALHRAISHVEYDDPDLEMLASFLTYACRNGGLSSKQAKWANSILRRVRVENGF